MSEPRTVLMLTLLGDDPATTRYYAGIARTLDRRRYRLVFGTVRPAGIVQEAVGAHGHSTFTLGCRTAADYPRAVSALCAIVHRERVDLIHGNEELASCLTGVAGLLAGIAPRIYHRQHDVSSSFDPHEAKELPWRDRLLRRLASVKYGAADWLAGALAHSVITLSTAHQAAVLAERPQWRRKTTVVFHGIDAPKTLEGAQARATALRQELANDGPALTIVARLNWRKGHAVLLEALARLVRRGLREPALLLVGYGPLDATIRAKAAALALSRVHFLGKQQNVWPYYLAGDVTLVPSLTEPFGLVAIEAMACGRALIASALGGLREIVVDNETGLLVPPGDPDALAAAIERLLADPAATRRMGEAARRRFDETFSQERMTERWQALYDRLLAVRHA